MILAFRHSLLQSTQGTAFSCDGQLNDVVDIKLECTKCQHIVNSAASYISHVGEMHPGRMWDCNRKGITDYSKPDLYPFDRVSRIRQ